LHLLALSDSVFFGQVPSVHREITQLSFADHAISDRLGLLDGFLRQIDKMLDWSQIEKSVDEIYDANVGRPSYPPPMLTRMLLLSTWYELSDCQIEAELKNRVSFRRFIGLRLDDRAPDHSTLSRFRKQLRKRQLDTALLSEIDRQLSLRNLTVRNGAIVEAALIRR
jgi:transposase, IS5 family